MLLSWLSPAFLIVGLCGFEILLFHSMGKRPRAATSAASASHSGPGPEKHAQKSKGEWPAHVYQPVPLASKDGFRNITEISNYMDRAWVDIFDSAGAGGETRMAAMRGHCGAGVELATQYSGKGTAETCFLHMRQKIEFEGLQQAQGSTWVATTCFDSKPACLKALKQHDGPCIFGAMESVLTKEAQLELDHLAPAKSQNLDEKKKAYSSMATYLESNLPQVMPDDHKAVCARHSESKTKKVLCKVWPSPSGRSGAGMMRSKLWVAGQDCRDVSRRGHCEGFAGKFTRCYKVWIHMLRKARPKMFIHEITVSKQAAATLAEDVGDLFVLHTIKGLCPTMLGCPTVRPRMYTVGILKGVAVSTGSWQDFMELCGNKKCVIDGSAYVLAPHEDRLRVARLASQRKGWYTPEDTMPNLEDMCTPLEIGRLEAWQQKHKASASPGKPFICDVQQSDGFGSVSDMAPCLTSHGKLVLGNSADANKSEMTIAIGAEHMLMMGEPRLKHIRNCRVASFLI